MAEPVIMDCDVVEAVEETPAAPAKASRKRKRLHKAKASATEEGGADAAAATEEEAKEPPAVLPLDGYLAHVAGARRESSGELVVLLRSGWPVWWSEAMVARTLARWICRVLPKLRTMRQGSKSAARMRWPMAPVETEPLPEDAEFPRLGPT